MVLVAGHSRAGLQTTKVSATYAGYRAFTYGSSISGRYGPFPYFRILLLDGKTGQDDHRKCEPQHGSCTHDHIVVLLVFWVQIFEVQCLEKAVEGTV